MNDTANRVIEFRHVAYSVARNHSILADLNLVVNRGETLMMLGRSGSGKTTALKLINRLLSPSSGEVLVDDKPSLQWDPIQLRRRIGYAIQDVGLFPHYTVWQNVALVPKLEKWDPQRISHRVEEVLQLVGLPGRDFSARYPNELSGGQRQRVGLARALLSRQFFLWMSRSALSTPSHGRKSKPSSRSCNRSWEKPSCSSRTMWVRLYCWVTALR